MSDKPSATPAGVGRVFCPKTGGVAATTVAARPPANGLNPPGSTNQKSEVEAIPLNVLRYSWLMTGPRSG